MIISQPLILNGVDEHLVKGQTYKIVKNMMFLLSHL